VAYFNVTKILIIKYIDFSEYAALKEFEGYIVKGNTDTVLQNIGSPYYTYESENWALKKT
jgi:hypothetical protein